MNTVLIAGSSGIVGSAAVEHFLRQDGYEVIAISRRPPEVDAERPFRHVAVDLRDEAAAAKVFSEMGEVTHLVYAALFEKPGLVQGWRERDQMEVNLAMIRNLLDPLAAVASGLEHVSLLQGTKAYGVHLHRIPIPARERDPRDDHQNFYWLQEDYVREKAATHDLRWTVFRPQIITGGATGVAMNVVPVIGAYAAICEHQGLPFSFPGGPSYVSEVTDARLLAAAFEWAAHAPQADGEHFNITNGDVFEWRNLWPAFARDLGVEPGPGKPRQMATWLPERADVWSEIADRHDLRHQSLDAVLGQSSEYADFCFAYGGRKPPPPALVSTVELRQAGFLEFLHTDESFLHWFEVLRRRRILPT
jgi:nucleoside-diphosphate-sugar epimerase